MQQALGSSDDDHFRKTYLQPTLTAGLIEMTLPDKPTSRLQKYRLTEATMPHNNSSNHSLFAHAADLIAAADALVIAAGAGMGVDSGLPDFQGRDGFWQAYPALAKAKLDFTDVASPRTFVRDPALAWGLCGHRLSLYRRTLPHALSRLWRCRSLTPRSVRLPPADCHKSPQDHPVF